MQRHKVLGTICSFSLQFPPITGVDFVLLEDGNLEFRLRIADDASTPTDYVTEYAYVSERQLDMILRLMEVHRSAHAP
jgi:hypothetical protein